MANTSLGTLSIAAAAIGDALGWIIVAFVLAGLASSGVWGYTRVLLETVLFAVGMLWVIGPFLRRELVRLEGADPMGLGLLLAAVMGSAYLTDRIGIHPVFGAFLLGAVLPRWQGAVTLTRWRRAITPIVIFFLPVYFVVSGLAVNVPGIHPRDALYLALILLAASAGKFASAFVAARASGLTPRAGATVGVLMNTRGLIEIVLLTIGLEKGIIEGRLFTLLVLMALITTLLAPPLVRRLRQAMPGSHVPENPQAREAKLASLS